MSRILGEDRTYGINGRFVTTEKNVSINLGKGNTKFLLSLHYYGDNSYLFVNRREIFKFKADNKNINFPTQFYLGSISNEFGVTASREVSLKENVYGFSVDYNDINKSDILNIHKYLMVKNKTKEWSLLLNMRFLFY